MKKFLIVKNEQPLLALYVAVTITSSFKTFSSLSQPLNSIPSITGTVTSCKASAPYGTVSSASTFPSLSK